MWSCLLTSVVIFSCRRAHIMSKLLYQYQYRQYDRHHTRTRTCAYGCDCSWANWRHNTCQCLWSVIIVLGHYSPPALQHREKHHRRRSSEVAATAAASFTPCSCQDTTTKLASIGGLVSQHDSNARECYYLWFVAGRVEKKGESIIDRRQRP